MFVLLTLEVVIEPGLWRRRASARKWSSWDTNSDNPALVHLTPLISFALMYGKSSSGILERVVIRRLLKSR